LRGLRLLLRRRKRWRTSQRMHILAKDCGVSAGEFIDKFLNEIEDLKSIEVKK
jgi:hypothetical protein